MLQTFNITKHITNFNRINQDWVPGGDLTVQNFESGERMAFAEPYMFWFCKLLGRNVKATRYET